MWDSQPTGFRHSISAFTPRSLNDAPNSFPREEKNTSNDSLDSCEDPDRSGFDFLNESPSLLRVVPDLFDKTPDVFLGPTMIS